MSPRYAARDEHGRPIVAELGRAETPQETADRRAATSRAHREGKTMLGLIGALVGSLAVVAFLVLVVVRPDQAALREPVDYVTATAHAQSSYDNLLVAPELDEGWSASFARVATASDVAAWEIGFVTPERTFLQLTQAFDTNPTWLAAAVRDAKAGPMIELGGLTWTSYDRREVKEPGNVAYALVTELDGRTIVISGTASDDNFATLATATATKEKP